MYFDPSIHEETVLDRDLDDENDHKVSKMIHQKKKD